MPTPEKQEPGAGVGPRLARPSIVNINSHKYPPLGCLEDSYGIIQRKYRSRSDASAQRVERFLYWLSVKAIDAYPWTSAFCGATLSDYYGRAKRSRVATPPFTHSSLRSTLRVCKVLSSYEASAYDFPQPRPASCSCAHLFREAAGGESPH